MSLENSTADFPNEQQQAHFQDLIKCLMTWLEATHILLNLVISVYELKQKKPAIQ